MLFQYRIDQYPQEQTPVSQLFDFRLYDAVTNVSLATANVYDYSNNGFGIGIGSIYFKDYQAPADTDSLYLMISGNPAFWQTSIPKVQYTVTGSNFIDGNQRNLLAGYIISQAKILEINWAVKMWEAGATGGAVLSLIGQEYFTVTIPGLQAVAPEIMGTIILDPNWNHPKPGTDAAVGWEEIWDGTIIKDFLTEWGDKFSIRWNALSGGILFIIMLLCAGYSQMKWGNGDPGFYMGNIILITGTLFGLVWWPIFMVECIGLAFWIAHNMWWKNG